MQGLVQVRDQIKFGDAVIKLQAQILAAQQGASSAQSREMEMADEIRELKAHVTELEKWDAEKKRYKMGKLTPGIIVYLLKEECATPGELIHPICPTCYSNCKSLPLHQGETSHGQYDLTYMMTVVSEKPPETTPNGYPIPNTQTTTLVLGNLYTHIFSSAFPEAVSPIDFSPNGGVSLTYVLG